MQSIRVANVPKEEFERQVESEKPTTVTALLGRAMMILDCPIRPGQGGTNMQIFHLMTPVVFRMLERPWVDKFFETGELRLSSFAQFAKHTDEQRKDKEGNNTITLRGASTTGFARIHGSGSNAYVLCATALEPSQTLLKAFNNDAAIQIFDAMGFAPYRNRFPIFWDYCWDIAFTHRVPFK